MNYELGIRKLRELVDGNSESLLEVALHESKLIENIERSRKLGHSSESLVERNAILYELNGIALHHSRSRETFSDLCRPSATKGVLLSPSLRSALPNLGSGGDLGPAWLDRRLEEVIEGINRVERDVGFSENEYVDTLLTKPGWAGASYRMLPNRASDSSRSTKEPAHERRFSRIVDAFNGTRAPIVLLGDPGGGKSVSIRHLGLELAKAQLKRGRSGSNLLPLYIHLGDYVGKADSGRPESLLKFLLSLVPTATPQDVVDAERNLISLAQSGELVFLFDSLDEMARDDYTARYDELRALMGTFALCRFVFTCRKIDYDERLAAAQLVVEPISRRQIDSYLLNLLTKGCSWSKSRAQDSIERLRLQHAHIYDLLSNPFYLRLVAAYLASHGTLPGDLSTLYAELVHDCWAHKYGSPRNAPKNNEEFTRFLRELSWVAYCITRDAGVGTTVDIGQLASISTTKGIVPLEQSRIEDVIAKASRLRLVQVREVGTRSIAFQHHRFQEYFTALFLARSPHPLSVLLPKTGLLGGIWWQESITLLAAISPDPEKVVSFILELQSDSDVGHFGLTPDLRTDLLKSEKIELIARCYQVAHSRIDKRFLFKLLGSIVGDLPHADPTRRVLYLRVLSLIDHPRAREVLRELLEDRSAWVRKEAFAVVLRTSAGGVISRRFVIRYLFDSLRQGGFWRGLTVAGALLQHLRCLELVPLALLVFLIAFIRGFFTVLLNIAIPLVLWLLGVPLIIALPAFVAFLWFSYSHAKIYSSIGFRAQLGAAAMMLTHAAVVLAVTHIHASFWIVPVSLAGTLLLFNLALRLTLGAEGMQERVKKGQIWLDQHQLMHDEQRALAQQIEANAGVATAKHIDDLFALFSRGCLHIHQGTVDILKTSRVDPEAFQRLKFHAGRIHASNPYSDDLWISVRAKELEVRRYLTEMQEKLAIEGRDGAA